MLQKLVVFVVLCAALFAQTPPPSYNPADCSEVAVGSEIEVTNNSTVEWIFIQPMINGVPVGDPVLIAPGATESFPVPNWVGATYRLDPTSPSTDFNGL